MVQVKVFQEKTSDLKVFQGAVNQFLHGVVIANKDSYQTNSDDYLD